MVRNFTPSGDHL